MSNNFGAAAITTDSAFPSSPLFVEVAVPLHVSKTFLYRLPPHTPTCEPGTRILVPLGRNLVTGFVVGLHSVVPSELGLAEEEIKEAETVIDSVPVCIPEILDITRWVADYYLSLIHI